MTDPNLTTIENQLNGASRGGFLQYVSVLLRWRRFIIVNVVVVTLIAVAVSLVLPKWYRATASILPPKDQGLFNLLGSTNSLLKGLGPLSKLGGLGQNSGAYNYFAILKSRQAMESVVKKFGLVSIYGVEDSSLEKTVKELRDNVSFQYQDDDYITLEVTDKDPQRAADMANYYVELLNSMSIELGTREAKNNRSFIEQRVQLAKDSLRNAEESMKRFQERSGMLITPEQSSTLSSIADLYASRAKKEIELAILEQRLTKDNDLIQQLQLEVREFDKRLALVPQAGLEIFRLYRDVMTQQKILEFLVPLYEQAKLNEQKDVPVLLVLDKAIRPEKKIRPQRLLIILSAFFLSLFSMVAIAFALQALALRGTTGEFEHAMHAKAQKVASFYRVDVGT